ncbi:hypothetical protein, partial [Hominenteromicrobium sp.]|uniref:hypothetical protein n=1 Tax=Hominenteromicrobium sp. TaxID=3073581 RepID=UPI003A8D4AA8
FGSFSNTIYRNLALALSKLHINVDITVGFFVGQKNYRLDAESFEPERTRPSVRQQIQEIKAERQTEKQKQPARDKTRQTTHKQPQKNKYREKGSKCNGELRQSVFKSAAVQRATL